MYKKICSCLISYLVIGISCLMLLTACSQNIELQTSIAENDANEMISVLMKAGISASKKTSKEGATVMVKDSEISKAMAVLNANGLPRKQTTGLGEIFKKEGMISTPLEERARYIFGLSQELEKTLNQIDDVVTARVHVVLPERIAPGEPIMPSSASVFIKHKKTFDADAMTPRIRSLVSTSIPGLSDLPKEKISIVYVDVLEVKNSIEWTMVGPVKVDSTSVGTLQTILFILFALVVLSMGFAALAVFKPREVRRALRLDKK
jgi:type III secretion protein J